MFSQELQLLKVDLEEMIEEFWEECVFLQLLHNTGTSWKRRKEAPVDEAQKIGSIGLQVKAYIESLIQICCFQGFLRSSDEELDDQAVC